MNIYDILLSRVESTQSDKHDLHNDPDTYSDQDAYSEHDLLSSPAIHNEHDLPNSHDAHGEHDLHPTPDLYSDGNSTLNTYDILLSGVKLDQPSEHHLNNKHDLASEHELHPTHNLHTKSQYLQDLFEVIHALNHNLPFDNIINLLLETLVKLSGEQNVSITILSEDKSKFEYVAGIGLYEDLVGYRQDITQGLHSELWETQEPIYIEDYQSYEQKIPDSRFSEIRSIVLVPLITRQEILGVVNVGSSQTKNFDEVTLNLLENYVPLASNVIKTAKLKTELQRKNNYLEVLQNSSLSIIDHLKPSELYRSLVEGIVNFIGYGEAFLCLTKQDTLQWVADTLNSDSVSNSLSHKAGIIEQIYKNKEVVFINEYENDDQSLDIIPFNVKSIGFIPLIQNDQIIGILGIVSPEPFTFDKTLKHILKTYAELASTTIINAQAHQDLEWKTKELALLNELQKSISPQLELSQLLDISLKKIVKVFQGSAGYFRVLEGDYLVMTHSEGIDESTLFEKVHVQEETIQELIKTQQPIVLCSTTNALAIAQNQKTLVMAPIFIGGEIYGTLSLGHQQDNVKVNLELLQNITELIAMAIKNAQLHGRIKKDLLRTEAFYNVSQTIDTFYEIDDVVTNIAEICREALEARWAVIYWIDQDEEVITLQARAQLANESAFKFMDYDNLMESFTGWVMTEQESILTDDISSHTLGERLKYQTLNLKVGSMIVVPLIHQGLSLGSLGFINNRTDENFNNTDLHLAETIANQTVSAIVQHELSQQLEFQAYHDSLTTLPNRKFFESEVERLIAHSATNKSKFAVMFLDLDGFKHINDTLGHDVGDLLLKIVAKRIKLSARSQDIVARLGGDEFGVIVRDLDPDDKPYDIATRILESFNDPFILGSHSLRVSTSIGLSIYPKHGDDLQTLLKHADSAMYAAKHGGKNNIRIFIPEYSVAIQKRLEIENDLKHALKEKKFELFYQPQIDLKSETWIGAEALIRWKHPTKGYIAPSDFIPISEESTLIIDIGNWVLDEACKQASAWQSLCDSPPTIAVNISSSQFEAKDFIDIVTSTLEKYRLDPTYLELEVTESVMMNDVKLVVQNLKELKAMGIKIAIDDFGTGYSSLQYLNTLPIDKLKIDKTFVDQINLGTQTPLVAGILTLAQSLNLISVAEGIEEKEQADFLRFYGCEQAQGFYYAKPLTADEFSANYAQNSSKTETVLALDTINPTLPEVVAIQATS